MAPETIRQRFDAALMGAPVRQPVYAVYDWFVQHRPAVPWAELFAQGLGQIQHANVIRLHCPGFERLETTSDVNGLVRRDVTLVTDRGELHEWYLGEWRQEHFIKTPDDYRLMCRALEGVEVLPDATAFEAAEQAVGDGGITLGQIQGLGNGRTPLMVLQIDWVGLERWSLDVATDEPAMLDLLEVMTAITLDEIRGAARGPARQIKLWENLSIETMGPGLYRRYLAPLYRDILEILGAAGKRLIVHYDGKLRGIADDIAALDIDGLDSFTEPPEGDLTVAEARALWPDKFLWIHPNLGWYDRPRDQLERDLRRVVTAAGPSRFCLMVSEEVPPGGAPAMATVLEILADLPPLAVTCQ